MRWKGASRSIHQSPFPTDSADKGDSEGWGGVGWGRGRKCCTAAYSPSLEIKALVADRKKIKERLGEGESRYDSRIPELVKLLLQ